MIFRVGILGLIIERLNLGIYLLVGLSLYVTMITVQLLGLTNSTLLDSECNPIHTPTKTE